MDGILLVLVESEGSLLIDWNRINSLIDSDSEEDKKWLKDLIDTLLTNMEERMKNIQSFSQASDQEKLKAELHQVKGVASNFGLMDLYNLVVKSESLLHDKLIQESIQHTDSIIDVWNRTKQEILSH